MTVTRMCRGGRLLLLTVFDGSPCLPLPPPPNPAKPPFLSLLLSRCPPPPTPSIFAACQFINLSDKSSQYFRKYLNISVHLTQTHMNLYSKHDFQSGCKISHILLYHHGSVFPERRAQPALYDLNARGTMSLAVFSQKIARVTPLRRPPSVRPLLHLILLVGSQRKPHNQSHQGKSYELSVSKKERKG